MQTFKILSCSFGTHITLISFIDTDYLGKGSLRMFVKDCHNSVNWCNTYDYVYGITSFPGVGDSILMVKERGGTEL